MDRFEELIVQSNLWINYANIQQTFLKNQYKTWQSHSQKPMIGKLSSVKWKIWGSNIFNKCIPLQNNKKKWYCMRQNAANEKVWHKYELSGVDDPCNKVQNICCECAARTCLLLPRLCLDYQENATDYLSYSNNGNAIHLQLLTIQLHEK